MNVEFSLPNKLMRPSRLRRLREWGVKCEIARILKACIVKFDNKIIHMNHALKSWNSIILDPFFNNIPYKVETTRSGAILMSPASNWHGSAQSQVVVNLNKGRKGGEIINECSILTSDGVKVADVAWASEKFMDEHGYKTPYNVAPEICVEIVSPGNSKEEIEHKVDLYLAKGALEVWVVAVDASVSFYDKSGSFRKSKLVKSVTIKKRV